MNATNPDQPWTCPACGAELSPEATQCWLCHRSVSSLNKGPNASRSSFAGRSSGVPYETNARLLFHFASVMTLIAMVVVLLGIYWMAPGLAMVLAFCCIPPLFGLWRIKTRYKKHDPSMTTLSTILIVVSTAVMTLGIVLFITISVVTSFFLMLESIFNQICGGSGP